MVIQFLQQCKAVSFAGILTAFARMSWYLWSSCVDFFSLIIIRYRVYKLCQETAILLALLMNYCSSGQTEEKRRHWLSVPLCWETRSVDCTEKEGNILVVGK